MEIIGLGVLVIVAACIWSAWGPKVLLAAIVIPPVLGVSAIVIIQMRDTTEYKAMSKAKYAECIVELNASKAAGDQWLPVCNR